MEKYIEFEIDRVLGTTSSGKSIVVDTGDEIITLPLSLIKDYDSNLEKQTILIPKWLAYEKGLL